MINESKVDSLEVLVKIEVNKNQEPIVSGRELHEFLGLKTPYRQWFGRMKEYGFDEDVDFTQFTQKSTSSNASGVQATTDHVMKLDMAKELSMIQRNEKGKQARRYFIEVEKQYNSPEKIMARALIIAETTVNDLRLVTKKQEQIIGELKPKADYMDSILRNKGIVNITQISKDYGMSGVKLNRLLHNLKVQYKQGDQWLLYSKHQDKAYTHSETTDITRTSGVKDIKMRTKWTQKGRLFLYELLKEHDYLPSIEKVGGES